MEPERDNTLETLAKAVKTLRPQMEARRKRFMRWLLLGSIALTVAVSAVVFHFRDELTYPPVSAVSGALIPVVILFQILNGVYRRGAKAQFLNGISAATGFPFRPGGAFELSAAERHLILPPFNRHTIEDGFEGTYRGVPFALQEAFLGDLQQDPRHRNRRRELTVFNGLLVRIRLQRALEAHTVVIPQNVMRTFFQTRFSDYQRVKLVSPKFEKFYDVVSTDQIEARVILNPAFMERFMEAAKILNARWMDVSFFQNEILIAAQRFRPMFESGPLTRRITEKSLWQVIEELESVLKLIDVLKLNRQVAA